RRPDAAVGSRSPDGGSARGADAGKAVRRELARQPQQVGLERRGLHVVGGHQALEDDAERLVLLDQRPHARADLVESEVRAGLEVQQDRLALELAEHDVVADLERVREGDRAAAHATLLISASYCTCRIVRAPASITIEPSTHA